MVAVLKTVSFLAYLIRLSFFLVLIALASTVSWWVSCLGVLLYLFLYGGYEVVGIGILLDVAFGSIITPFGTTSFFFSSIFFFGASVVYWLRVRTLRMRSV